MAIVAVVVSWSCHAALVMHYPFTDGNFNDAVGSNGNATQTVEVSSGPCPAAGEALHLAPGVTAHVQCITPLQGVSGVLQWSLALWVRQSRGPSPDAYERSLLSLGLLNLIADQSGSLTLSWNAGASSMTAPRVMADLEWHYIAVNFDGITMQLAVDGQQQVADPALLSIRVEEHAPRFGESASPMVSSSVGSLGNFTIDEVMFYSSCEVWEFLAAADPCTPTPSDASGSTRSTGNAAASTMATGITTGITTEITTTEITTTEITTGMTGITTEKPVTAAVSTMATAGEPGLTTTSSTHVTTTSSTAHPSDELLAEPPAVVSPAAQKALEATGKVLAAMVLVGGLNVGSVSGKNTVLRENLACSVEDVDLKYEQPVPFEFHPTGLALGGRCRYLIGAVVMNVAVCAAVWAAGMAGALAVSVCVGTTFHRGLGMMRSPGVVWLVYVFLLTGTSLSSAQLLFAPGACGAGASVLGLAGLVVCCAFPMLCHMRVGRFIAEDAFLQADPKLYPSGDVAFEPYQGVTRWAYRFSFGEHVWVSDVRDTQFAEKYGVGFEAFRYGKVYLGCVDVVVLLALGLLAAAKPGPGWLCNLRNSGIAVVLFGSFGLQVAVRPCLSAMDNAALIINSGLTAVAVLCLSVGIGLGIEHDAVLLVAGGWLLVVAGVLTLAKALWDGACALTEICHGRKRDARAAAALQRTQGKKNVYVEAEENVAHMLASAGINTLGESLFDTCSVATPQTESTTGSSLMSSGFRSHPLLMFQNPRSPRVESSVPLLLHSGADAPQNTASLILTPAQFRQPSRASQATSDRMMF
eukprot:TRINITY_DN6709_c0_g1_i3.p1 TRINITY_DN6709_c0_g1~~TRINITY_DN6709_c0_g1_i3.p1  ORF type:complete len:809 (+),score=167.12 TRINITY_DN6709_c0_g1_i3:74-2500(+)